MIASGTIRSRLTPGGHVRVLKGIQARIQCLILNKVHYPVYLQGSIKDPISPRGQKANAGLHVRKRVLISEDITVSSFFQA